MGRYGRNDTIADTVTSENAYKYVYWTNSGYTNVKATVHNDHATNAIKYIIHGQMRSDAGEWIAELVETALAADSLDEIVLDSLFARYRIGYKSSVAATHSDDLTIEITGRMG